ncbi:MAG: cyclase family protein [Flavobacteriales bacterium]
MIATIEYKGKSIAYDLHAPIDLSIAISANGPRAWYVEEARIAPVINQQFTGSVKLGGGVNFNDVFFNPHGHGTHTESVGHISKELVSVNAVLKNYFFMAEIISLTPSVVEMDTGWTKRGDLIITKDQVSEAIKSSSPEALIIRTLPNNNEKRTRNYSNTNFCYIESEALAWLTEIGVEQLLVDLPSVDRESDGGLLLAHHAFWKNGSKDRLHCTITEFVFIPDTVTDGNYLLNLQVAPFENDASPSRAVVFKPLQ